MTVDGTTTIGGTTYNRLLSKDKRTALLATYLIRKDTQSNAFYWFLHLDDLNGFSQVTFVEKKIELLFLKESLSMNDSWTTGNLTAKKFFGKSLISYPAHFVYTVEDANATIVASGITVSQVYKISMPLLIITSSPTLGNYRHEKNFICKEYRLG
jgi:hypothetical protein